jgi:hypothetical protein
VILASGPVSADRNDRDIALWAGSHRQQEVGAHGGEPPRDDESDAVARARHERTLSGEVSNGMSCRSRVMVTSRCDVL